MKRLVAAGFISFLAVAPCAAEPGPGGSQTPPPPVPGAAEGMRRGTPDGERDGGWRHHPPIVGMKGGHLRFRKGDTGIDFRCAADDSTKACVDALTPLVEKLIQVR